MARRVLMGDIADDFMELPAEVLQTSMREHQKFFSVRNPKTGRIEKFITVANRETADQGATILAGNQKVLFARLSDAKFFWENDLRGSLADMAAKLENVTFHNKLGTQAERVARIVGLAREIAPIVGADADMAEAAAKVAKADLMSEMVYEFPELQGVMGRYYAQKTGLDDAIADACELHYSPLGPSDIVPNAPVAVAVALADKIDTLTGFWVIDEKPTGSKDPFALRRAALGVIRLVLENGVRVELNNLTLLPTVRNLAFFNTGKFADKAGNAFNALTALDEKELAESIFHKTWDKGLIEKGSPEDKALSAKTSGLQGNLLTFFHDRLKVYLRDQGISHDIIDACLAMPNNDDFTLLVNRAEALQAFIKTDDGTNLLQGFKRANNILTQAEAKDGVEYSYGADVKYAETDVERKLFAALATADEAIAPSIKSEDFATAMAAMASLRAPIDGFFEAVKINADSDIVRRNRLNLLGQIRKTMGQVADFTLIEG